MRERARGAIDYDGLALYLRTLGIPSRLELLRKLQVPLAASEVDLAPSREERDRNPDRAISRQAVEKHLKKLETLGLVTSRASVRNGLPVSEFMLNHARLFVVVEELRRISLIRASPGTTTEFTGSDDPDERGVEIPPGPALVLVGGPLEGRVFALGGKGPWTIGRERGLDVALPYDPFVSKENTRLRLRDGAFHVEDVPDSRNGTRVNWRRLAPGESVRLVPGDTVGAGRSLFLFRGG